MKAYRMIQIILFLAVWIVVMTGCEYDVAKPKYYDKFVNPPTPVITGVIPAQADAGVNTITIQGENFSTSPDGNKVYFGTFDTEVISASSTSLVVRRPNVTGEVAVKVVPHDAIEIARYLTPYKVDTVVESYGKFVENKQIGAIAVDKDENVFVVLKMTTPMTVYKVPPVGEKVALSSVSYMVTDLVPSPEGKLVVLSNATWVRYMDPATGVVTDSLKLSKKASYGDFDQYGNLYVGAKSSDLILIKQDKTSSAVNVYSTDDIKDVRVYNDYVYVEAEAGTVKAIYRHKIQDASGALGPKEPVLDLSTTGDYASSVFKDIVISQDGIFYIATNNANPIMIYDPIQNRQDVLYKYIIPSAAEKLVWGNGNYVYMIQSGSKWDLLRINMGLPGAPYYGR
jgi:hypothetical protein